MLATIDTRVLHAEKREKIIKYVRTIDNLNENQKIIITDLFLDCEKVFSDLPGCTTAYEHTIKI